MHARGTLSPPEVNSNGTAAQESACLSTFVPPFLALLVLDNSDPSRSRARASTLLHPAEMEGSSATALAATAPSKKWLSSQAKTQFLTKLISTGAPLECKQLNTTWQLVRSAPDVNLHMSPQFISFHPQFSSSDGSLHLLHSENCWKIASTSDSGTALAIAHSTAAHPNTIAPGEWNLPKSGGGWVHATGFKVRAQGPNTEEQPFDIVTELGVDFFLRGLGSREDFPGPREGFPIVWFVDPFTGEVLHSGAKAAGTKKPGKRYCSLCERSFSANNFVTQHLRGLHAPPAPSTPTAMTDGTGGVFLEWTIEGWAAGAQPVSFSVQFSTDGGVTWLMGIEDTLSDVPRAHVTSLNPLCAYKFRVAAHSVAAVGPYGDASVALTIPTLGRPLVTSTGLCGTPGCYLSQFHSEPCTPFLVSGTRKRSDASAPTPPVSERVDAAPGSLTPSKRPPPGGHH